jgi:hypothetical protein
VSDFGEKDALAVVAAGLKPQEKAFADHWVSDPKMSIAGAVRAAGYAVSDKSANHIGEGILRQDSVQRYIAAIFAERRERHRDIRDGCLQALWQLACGWDIKDLIGTFKIEEEGVIRETKGCLPPDELPAPLRAAIKSVTFQRGRWSYTFVDKSQILMLILRHFGELDKLAGPAPIEATPKVKMWTGEEGP